MTILHSTRYKWQPGVLIHSVYSCSWKYSTVFLQVCVRLLSRFPKCSLTTLFEETRRSRMSRVPANAQNNSSFWPFFLFTTYFGTVWKVLRHFTQVRLVILSVTSNPLNLKYTLAIKAFTLTGGSEWSSIKKVLWILWRVIRNVKNVCRFCADYFYSPFTTSTHSHPQLVLTPTRPAILDISKQPNIKYWLRQHWIRKCNAVTWLSLYWWNCTLAQWVS